MAVEVTTLELNARLTNAEQTIAGLQRMGSAGKQAELSFGAVGKQILGFGTAAGAAVLVGQKLVSSLVDMGKQSVVLAASFEKSRMTWGVLVGDMQKGSQVFDKLYAFAAKTPLSFEGVNQAATTIKGFGVATDQLIPTLSRLGDLAMGDNAKLSQLALVYGQVFAQGKAKTQDLYQFINAGVPIFNMLATSMGKSAGEIKEIAATGAVTFDEIAKAIRMATSAGGQFYDMGNKVAETTAGKWSTAMDNWKNYLSDIGTTTLPIINKALDKFNAAMEHSASVAATFKLVSTGVGDAQATIRFLESEIAKEEKGMAAGAVNPRLAILKTQLSIARSIAATGYGDVGASGNLAPKPKGAGASAGDGSGGVGPSPYYGYSLSGDVLLQHAIDYNSQTYGPNPSGYNFSSAESPGIANASWSQVSAMQTPWAIADANKLAQVNDAWKQIGQTLQGIAASSISETFKSIGESIAMGADGGQNFANAMANLGRSALEQASSLAITLGMKMLLEGNPAGWAFLAYGGVGELLVGLTGGYGFSNGTSTGASAADMAALTAYYQKTEAFNAQGRNRTLGYAHGGIPMLPGFSAYRNTVVNTPHFFGFASGGVFGEAGYEAAVPLKRMASGNLGVETSGAGVVVNIHNYAGADVTQSESVDANGMRVLDVYLDKKIDAKLARVSAQQAARSGRRVTT